MKATTCFKRNILALIAGTGSAFAQAPFHLLLICFITFPLLIWLLDGIYAQSNWSRRKQLAQATLTGWCFGFGYFVAGLWWLGAMMLTDGGSFGWAMLPLAAIGLPALMASYYAFAVFFQALIGRHGYARLIALSMGFGLAEWLRSTLLTGFPWNAIGYSLMPTPLLMQIAALIGINGTNMLAVLLYASPILLVSKSTTKFERKLGLAVAFCLICLIVGSGMWRLNGLTSPEKLAQGEGTRVRLIQPSIPQSEKLDDTARFENFTRHLDLTKASPLPGQAAPDLIIWPETSVPYILALVPQATQAIAQALQPNQLALVGTVRAQLDTPSSQPRYYNSLEVIDAKSTIIAHADKMHLVPFGEYLPLSALFNLLGLSAAAEMTGGYTTASHHVSLSINQQVTILPLICYEAIFAHEMNYQGEAANVLLNISNDAWYGATAGPYQHFHQARLRTVEQGMPLIRVANNGISAVVDPHGRIIASLSLNEIGFVDAALMPAISPIWQGGPGFLQFFILQIIFGLIFYTLRLYR